MGRATRRHVATAALAVAVLALDACSGSAADEPATPSTRPDRTTATSTTNTTSSDAAAWRDLDRRLGSFGPDVGFLAARVADDGTCEPVHAVAPDEPRPTASQFKLFVLGALVDEVDAGRIAWDRELTVDDAVHSLGNGAGSLQLAPAGSTVSVEDAATTMISISDNTAADLLAGLVGRDEVEAQFRAWSDHAELNEPFLTTRQVFLLHYVDGLGDRYLATDRADRPAFLASEVDPLALGEIGSGFSTDPRYIDRIEWFASPADVCRAFAGLRSQAERPSAQAELPPILSEEVGSIGLDRATWPTVWFKGGSEPGVLTLGWLATDDRGRTFVVEAMVSNPEEPLAEESIVDLVHLAEDAFALLS
ncbi:MAG: serine hydrolase [Actinobacteria bacterium]|nr:serine hydrolase [Actinomycetota bacterium]